MLHEITSTFAGKVTFVTHVAGTCILTWKMIHSETSCFWTHVTENWILWTFPTNWGHCCFALGSYVKKCGHSKSDARAANHIFLKSLDCLETLENGYNLKEIMFSAPKWAGQGGQISFAPLGTLKSKVILIFNIEVLTKNPPLGLLQLQNY